MRAFLIKYRLVFRFIIVFVLVYSVLTLAYNQYLTLSNGSNYYPDYLTHLVAKQSQAVMNSVGYTTEIVPHNNEPSMKLIVRGKFIATVVEGCNAVSIIILFLSFIVAFADEFKKTFLFALAGSCIIYAFNLFRIAILTIALYHYPSQQDILHTVIFPLLIYGTVFVLWMIWVNRFSKSKKND